MSAFVQANSFLNTGVSQGICPFLSPQADGNLNVVVAWFRAPQTTVESVTDSAGNVYTQIMGSATIGSTVVQPFYCCGIQPAAQNIVTVTVNGATTNLEIAIAEFSGLGPNVNPIDTTGSATGTSVGPASVTLTTSNANDMLIGFGSSDSANLTGAAGSGYTLAVSGSSRVLIEYLAVSVSGAQAATTAPIAASASWIMQAVAFKNATSPTQVPVDVITSWVGIHRIGLS